MLSILIGLIVSALGLVGIIVWIDDMVIFLRGMFPVCFFFSGILAIVAGVSSLKKDPYAKKDEGASNDRKKENSK